MSHPNDFMVYYKDTTIYAYRKAYGPQAFVTEAAAKAAITRLVNKGADRDNLAYCRICEFGEIEQQVERTNLMSGKKFMEPINTPHFCSPAFESYWSM